MAKQFEEHPDVPTRFGPAEIFQLKEIFHVVLYLSRSRSGCWT
jgi:hypothetical protein